MTEQVTAASIFASIRYTFFTASTQYKKYTVAEQRELFGEAIFGKKSIVWDAKLQRVETFVTTISRDYDCQTYTLDEIATLVNTRTYAHKGYCAARANQSESNWKLPARKAA